MGLGLHPTFCAHLLHSLVAVKSRVPSSSQPLSHGHTEATTKVVHHSVHVAQQTRRSNKVSISGEASVFNSYLPSSSIPSNVVSEAGLSATPLLRSSRTQRPVINPVAIPRNKILFQLDCGLLLETTATHSNAISPRPVAMASTTAPAPQVPAGDDEVVHDYGLVRVYKSGRVERPLAAPPVPPGVDAATGVESKDVHLSHYSVRLYLPPAATSTPNTHKLPVIVYVHGGGFVAESAASPGCHRFLNTLAAACPALAVSIDYRLAPEHPLPAAYDDCLAALHWTLFSSSSSAAAAQDPWLAAHADLTRVFLAGDSAGANVCHHLAVHPDLAAGGVALKGAVLIHPWFWGADAVGGEPRDPAARAMGARLWLFACPEAAGMDDPRMNPTAPGAPALETMACERVLVCAAERDFLRWRARAYAEAVAAARGGAAVEMMETEGEGHVFYVFKPDGDKAREMVDRVVAFVNAP